MPVLVCDDSPVARLALTRRLEALGVRVVVAGSVAEASAHHGSALAGALLDLEMDDGLGTQVAAVLRGGSAEVPIAFFTSATDRVALSAAEAYGPVFRKPDELERAVLWVLERAVER